jgi:hypothetical protein
VIAVEVQNSDQLETLVGVATSVGTKLSSVNRLTMTANSVAASQGNAPKRMPRPAANQAAPVNRRESALPGDPFGQQFPGSRETGDSDAERADRSKAQCKKNPAQFHHALGNAGSRRHDLAAR